MEENIAKVGGCPCCRLRPMRTVQQWASCRAVRRHSTPSSRRTDNYYWLATAPRLVWSLLIN